MMRKLTSTKEACAAVDQVWSSATRSVRVFDIDLQDGGYASPGRYELMRRFLLASRNNRVQIAVHDIDYIARRCARVMTLLRQFPYAVEIHQTLPAARHVADTFIVADKTSYWRRYHYEDARSELVMNDETGAELLARRFGEIWELSEPAVSATVLGIW